MKITSKRLSCTHESDEQKQPRKVFCKKEVPRNFTKFTRNDLRPATLLKKRLWHSCFPVSFVKFLSIPFLIEHLLLDEEEKQGDTVRKEVLY